MIEPEGNGTPRVDLRATLKGGGVGEGFDHGIKYEEAKRNQSLSDGGKGVVMGFFQGKNKSAAKQILKADQTRDGIGPEKGEQKC